MNHDLTSLSATIDQHRRELSLMQSGTEKEEKAAYLKDLEKQKKKTSKAISRSESRISKSEKRSAKLNRIFRKQEECRTGSGIRSTHRKRSYRNSQIS